MLAECEFGRRNAEFRIVGLRASLVGATLAIHVGSRSSDTANETRLGKIV